MIRAIFGAGGAAHDIRATTQEPDMPCFVDEKFWKPNRNNVFPVSEFNPEKYMIMIGVAEPKDKKAIESRLPQGTVYWSYVHPSAQILDESLVGIGLGSMVGPNCVIVCNSTIGKHSYLNLATTIGHDTNLGDCFTSSPGVNISGDCNIGNRVYFGTNSCCRQKVTICDDVMIGMGAVVLNDINQPGIYIGCPARRINK